MCSNDYMDIPATENTVKTLSEHIKAAPMDCQTGRRLMKFESNAENSYNDFFALFTTSI